MVPLSAPGDRLLVRIDRSKGKVDFAVIEKIVEPSPFRIEPPCPYFGSCGGCDFQQLNYQAQLNAKKEIIKDCLRRIAGFDSFADFEIIPTVDEWHYRTRAQWQYDARDQRLGYFEAASHRVCDVAECAVLAPPLQQTLDGLRAQMKGALLPEDARYFRAVLGDKGVSVAAGSDRNANVSQHQPDKSDRGDASEIVRTICGESYRLDADSFFQTNADLLPQLIEATLNDISGDVAVELYCGVGLFTLPLARRFKHVIAVEASKTAASYARQNVVAARLSNAQIVNDDVANWLDHLDDEPSEGLVDRGYERNSASRQSGRIKKSPITAPIQRTDFLILDPPRTGVESRVIKGILRMRPSRLCYLSCDPATLARDLKKLVSGGYSIDKLIAFDMFPQTHHVEILVHLSG